VAFVGSIQSRIRLLMLQMLTKKINRVLTNIGYFQSVQSPGGEKVAIEKMKK
jgi:hypothetical protein